MLAAFAAVVLAAVVAVPQAPQGSGNLLLKGGTVWTGTNSDWPGAVSTMHARIVRGESLDPAVDAQRIDLPPNAFVMPGLQDAHGHLLGLGGAFFEVDLVGTTSFAQVVDKTKAVAAKLPKGSWVLGRGWDQNDWDDKAMPNHAALSAAIPDHPVWLVRIDGHAGLANALVLAGAGITRSSVDPSGGEILRDGAGEPTGVLVDNAMDAVRTPGLEPAQVRERLLAAQQACLAHGLTCVHDAGVSKGVLDAMLALHAEGKWVLRTYVMLTPSERELIARGPWQTTDNRIVVRAVKGYSDGALGSRGAALLAEYADRPGYRGLAMMPKGSVLLLAQQCADAGMQLCVHAIGDAANRAVLDGYQAVQIDGGLAPLRFRIEHAQVLAADDFARFRGLGILPSMQPTHLTSDMPWATERLGPDRVLRAYAWRSFHRLGVVVPFGSDFPVESVDPRKGLFAAVTTRSERGGPATGWRPDQKLSREQALRGFTLHAAYGMFAENDLGTIEVRKRGDFTVWDRDLRVCSDEELLAAKVLLVVIDGRVVHDARAK